MSDNSPNPHVAARGDSFNEDKYEKMITEATGKTKEVRQKEFTETFEGFKKRLRDQLDFMRKRIYSLEMENNTLKMKIHSLENKLKNDNGNHE